jgi:hypothetical protein
MGKWRIEVSKSQNFSNELLKIANSAISRLQSAMIEDKETIVIIALSPSLNKKVSLLRTKSYNSYRRQFSLK